MTGPDADIFHCRICGQPAVRTVVATERMFGMGGAFRYAECGGCGSVQLIDVPADLSPYYPADRYYSLATAADSGGTVAKGPLATAAADLRRRFARLRNRSALFGRPRVLAPLAWWRPIPPSAEIRAFTRHLRRRSFAARVLDVGSGHGQLLATFAAHGFTDLHGVDPYLSPTTVAPPGVTLHRCELSALDAGRFDLIISHHSLEHVLDPRATLTAMRERLASDGVCRVEVPVAQSAAWREYGADWAELDPPRHLVLHTRDSMARVAADAGLAVFATEPAGTPIEFWASELYRRGMTYYDPARGRLRTPADQFTPAEIAAFEARSQRANADGTCGRLAFWLTAGAGRPTSTL